MPIDSETDVWKCDESRPVCLRCRRNSRQCTYTQLNHSQESDQSNYLSCLNGNGGPSILSSVTVIPFSSAKNGTSSLHLLQHFHRHWAEIFQVSRGDEIISLSKSNSLVRNTILAITACHLRHVSPGILQHRIAEHFQQSLALQDYKRALETPTEKLGQSGVAALVLSALLLNMLAFALPESEASNELDPSASWVFSPRKDRLGWLALQAGLRPLLRSMEAYIEETLSFLGSIFLGGDEKRRWASVRVAQGLYSLEDVPETWRKIFELDSSGSGLGCESAGGNFRAPVAILAQLRHVEPVRSNVFKNIQFLGKVHLEFRALLYDRDERALWLFGYWLGLLCRFGGVWWCEKRVKRDYKAIHMWLEQLGLTKRPGVEGEMWKDMMREFELASIFVRS